MRYKQELLIKQFIFFGKLSNYFDTPSAFKARANVLDSKQEESLLMPNQDAPPEAQGLSRSRARCSFGAVLAFCVYHAGFALAQTPPTDSSATKQASSPPSRVIVPLGSDENLRARITSIQLVGELPADVPLDEVSAILSAPRSITRLSELQLLAQRIE